ncbi:Hypothetical protein A7982_05620 [Minicystis rosea]|nr:Hypothetical protein A7982_05620 [Minicystis rosea]
MEHVCRKAYTGERSAAHAPPRNQEPEGSHCRHPRRPRPPLPPVSPRPCPPGRRPGQGGRRAARARAHCPRLRTPTPPAFITMGVAPATLDLTLCDHMLGSAACGRGRRVNIVILSIGALPLSATATRGPATPPTR